jgi:hypothetical protein
MSSFKTCQTMFIEVKTCVWYHLWRVKPVFEFLTLTVLTPPTKSLPFQLKIQLNIQLVLSTYTTIMFLPYYPWSQRQVWWCWLVDVSASTEEDLLTHGLLMTSHTELGWLHEYEYECNDNLGQKPSDVDWLVDVSASTEENLLTHVHLWWCQPIRLLCSLDQSDGCILSTNQMARYKSFHSLDQSDCSLHKNVGRTSVAGYK